MGLNELFVSDCQTNIHDKQDAVTEALLRGSLQRYQQARVFYDAFVRQLSTARAGLEEAIAADVDTADWEYIVRSAVAAVTREKLELERLRAEIAKYSGLRYIPPSFS